MRWLRFAVLLLVITILQASIVDKIAVVHSNIRPDLLLILLVFFATHCDSSAGIIISFSTGFAADIIGASMGPQMLSFGLFGTLLTYLHRVIAIRKMPYQSLMIFLTGLLTGLLSGLLSFLKGHSVATNLYTVILGTSIYSALVGPFLFLPTAWWMHIKTHRFSAG